MRSSWFKWVLIVAILLMSGGNAHAAADHAMTKADAPCATHHHHDADHHDSDHHLGGHQECCCNCLGCPAASLITPDLPYAPRPVAYDLHLAPAPASPLASRFLPPELDPPRPGTLS